MEGGGSCGLPLPAKLGSPREGEVSVCGRLCQMAFDMDIDANGVWIMTLSVARALLPV